MVQKRTPVTFSALTKLAKEREYYFWVWCLSQALTEEIRPLPKEVVKAVSAFLEPFPVFWLEPGDLVFKTKPMASIFGGGKNPPILTFCRPFEVQVARVIA